MRSASCFIILGVLVTQAYSAPQFVTFKDGKLGVNFGGYHAGVGLGGILGGGEGSGGLYAEAGTPFGPAARAGLGGTVDGSGGASGGLYAGATAGGNVKAAAGLGGEVGGEKSTGGGFASASAGNYASSGLGGESSVAESGGFKFSGTKTIGIPSTIVKETEVSVQPIENVKVRKEIELESNNEISSHVNAGFEANAEAEPTVVKEVSKWRPRGLHHKRIFANINNNVMFRRPQWGIQPGWGSQPNVYKHFQIVEEPQPVVVRKEVVHTHYKPSHEFQKNGYIGGYIGAGAGYGQPSVVKTVQPVIRKRIDVDVESEVNGAAAGEVDVHNGGGGQVTYTKQVSVSRNPTLFQDIFNIPISTLKAVSNLLGGIVGGTTVSVQKTASVQAGGYAH